MKLYKAEITDIIRSSQRDQDFVNELQDYVAPIINLLTGRKFNYLRKYIPGFATGLYYFLTSASNLQTLGEEYTGTLRINVSDDIPAQWAQILWLGLFIGGESLYDKLLTDLGKKVYFSSTLTEQAKGTIITVIDFLKENKYILIRLHHSIFYINGSYQNISNRFSGIKYVLLRQWMQDSNTTKSFKILGQISFCYLLIAIIEKIYTHKKSAVMNIVNPSNISAKVCVLCVENRKNTCVTPCGHLFCWECIYESLQHQHSCPICRESIQPSRIILLQNYF